VRVLISGGKTGGHLIPGITLYEEAKRRGHEVVYFLGPQDDRFAITRRIATEERRIVPIGSLSRKLSLKTPLWILKILRAFGHTFGEVRRFQPDVVIITGGYISNPIALSALLLGRPLYILEQNTVAGITNRLFAPMARRVFTSFPHTEKIPPNRIFFTGNPSIFSSPLPREEARRFFGIPEDALCLGVIGGSQGASRLNEIITEALPFFHESGIYLLWSVGGAWYQRLIDESRLETLIQTYPRVRLFPFIERMDALWGACDGVVARSGATTVSEVINACCPALFVPIYRSPDDHQKKNALAIQQAGGADILEEPAAHQIIPVLRSFLSTLPQKRRALQNLKDTYPSTPAKLIMDTIEKDLIPRR